jgi:hypothetical protein
MEESMDDRERIARVEATVDAHSKQFDRIDQSLRDLRVHTDRGLAELRDHMDRGFAELRSELTKTTRGIVGILVVYGITLAGLVAKGASGP